MVRSARAFTLVELTLVLLILSIVAGALALGPPTAASQRKVDLAAETVAMALRYARSEAIRVGEPHAGAVVAASGRVYLAHPDLTTGGITLGSLLVNPLDKRDYDFTVGDLPGAPGVQIVSGANPFVYRGLSGAQSEVVFDPAGLPYFLAASVRHPLSSATITLRHGDAERGVVLSPSGRVSLQ